VYRVGALADGRPFLAMKLIKGSTLATLLRERPDTAADRGKFVAIFEQVCQAVAYAHSLRVIHRDLKPSNVMVGKFGEVQVMDWGLAKVLVSGERKRTEQPAADGTVIRTRQIASSSTPGGAGMATPPTRAGSVLGTPAYMAPEQAGGEVDRLDLPSDVFGLGSILCEILTGQPPYASRDEDQIYRMAMHANQTDAHARLAACGAEPELVSLCLRCLAPEPDDRPRDSGEVAAAVAALRAAAEERARRAELDSVRATEQSKRRRVLLAGSAIVGGVLLAGLSVSLWQMFRAVRAEVQAKQNLQAEQQAHSDEAKAREQAFVALRSMTAEVVEKKFAQGAVLTEEDRAFLRSVIAQFDAFAAIKGEDADSRGVRAEGRFRIGTMRQRLGEVNEAERDYDEAVNIQKQLVAEFPDRSEFRRQLATSRNNRGVLLRDKGRLKEAEQDYEEALRIRKQMAAEFPDRSENRADLATVHNNRGYLMVTLRRFQEARQDFDQSVATFKQLTTDFSDRPEFRKQLAASHNNRGALLRIMNQPREAEQDHNQAVSLLEQLTADSTSQLDVRQDLAMSHHNRGNVRFDAGRLREAEQDFDLAHGIRRQLAADFPNQPDRRNELASTCVSLAVLHRLNKNWAASKQLILEARPHLVAALAANPEHPNYRRVYRNHLGILAAAHAGLLEPGEAVRIAESRRDLGWDPPTDAFDAARFLCLCVPIMTQHDKLDTKQREDAAKFYGDAAIRLLHDAVSKGFKDTDALKNDADLSRVRQRDDFRTLVAELEGKRK
jgi:tetratricopeptide (TPR) repeat protein